MQSLVIDFKRRFIRKVFLATAKPDNYHNISTSEVLIIEDKEKGCFYVHIYKHYVDPESAFGILTEFESLIDEETGKEAEYNLKDAEEVYQGAKKLALKRKEDFLKLEEFDIQGMEEWREIFMKKISRVSASN